MTIKTVMILFLFLLNSQAQAGGNLVGNGAGLAEFQFQSAYNDLDRHIDFCLTLDVCDLTSEERVLLQKILKIAHANTSKGDRIKFVSEKDFPDFFNTAPGEAHRIAKTGLDQSQPIFVNRDFLYDDQGNARLEYSTIAALLVHEVGHQTGETNHQILDILGAKVEKAISSQASKYEIKLGKPEKKIEAHILTVGSPIKRSEIYLSVGAQQFRKISDDISSSIECSEPSQSLSSFQFYNGHFTLSEKQLKDEKSFGFACWAELYCFDQKKRVITNQRFRVSMELNFELQTLTSTFDRF